jgi:hypothetical protein
MMSQRAIDGRSGAISGVIERARVSAVHALVLYLAKPVGEFATLASTDQRALATLLRRGDVLLSAGSTRCAELVKRLTRSSWSHVSMYVGALEGGPDPRCVVEAHIAGGVRTIRLSELDARRICALRPVGLDDVDRGRLAESVLRHVGSEYDFMHACLLACSLLLRRGWLRLRAVPTRMRRSATRFICSSLIAEAFVLIGRSIPNVGGTASDREAHQQCLVPSDFERASVFAIVWPVNGCDERT